MTEFIIRYENVFSKGDCSRLISYIDEFESNNLLFHDKNKLHQQNDKNINLGHRIYDHPAASKISTEILPKFKPCVDQYLETFSVLGQGSFLLYDCKLKKIPAGAGFHAWHYENYTMLTSARMFVVQLYLNDSFEGGETEFLYQNKREKAVAGDVLIFPCGYTHVHRGNPPIGGTKYLVTSWGWLQESGELVKHYESYYNK